MNPICPECKSDQVYLTYEHKTFRHAWKCPDCGDEFEIDESEESDAE